MEWAVARSCFRALEGEERPFYLSTKLGFEPEDLDYTRESGASSVSEIEDVAQAPDMGPLSPELIEELRQLRGKVSPGRARIPHLGLHLPQQPLPELVQQR
jgi:hypothetical protein